MSRIIGGCLCGSIRYASDAEPLMTAVCHCKNCQKQTSSAFSLVIALPKGSVKLEGETLGAFQDVGTSGQPVTRRFCRNCGSALLSEAAAMPAVDFIKAGTLDDPSWLRPQMNIWCDRALPWVAIDTALQNFAGNPPLGS